MGPWQTPGLSSQPVPPHLSVRALLGPPVGRGGPALIGRLGLGAVPAAVAVAGVEALLFGGGGGVLLPLLGPAALLLLVLGRRLTMLGHWKENVGRGSPTRSFHGDGTPNRTKCPPRREEEDKSLLKAKLVPASPSASWCGDLSKDFCFFSFRRWQRWWWWWCTWSVGMRSREYS